MACTAAPIVTPQQYRVSTYFARTLRAGLKDDKATIAELQMQVKFAKKVATWFAKGKQ